jgi:hypothetical protein
MRSDAEKRRCRDRANRNRRALLNEKKKYGWYDDGGGKRYRIGVDYVAAGELEKAVEYFRWFDKEFSDDIGEPVFLLHWAVAEYRAGNLTEAKRRLKVAMLSNPYMLPLQFGEPQEKLDIWHSANWQTPEYLEEVGEFLAEPSEGEREWIRQQYLSESFKSLLAEFVAVHQALLHEHEYSRRCELTDRWRKFELEHLAHKT